MFDDYDRYDALGLAALVRTGQVTPLELVESAIARIEAVNPYINAVIAKTFDRARDHAARAPLSGVFAGVPWLLKDISDASGIPITMGSRALGGNVSQSDVPFVDAALASGLNIIGVSNVPEFGLLESTENLLYGPTRNPWNREYSAGGSSGGAAAAVAMGIVPMAHGNDGGGSLRYPASHCGLFALKPSRGRTLRAHQRELPFDIVCDGVISHSVRDTAAFMSVVESRESRLPRLGRIEHPQSRRLRIGLMLDLGNGVAVDPEVATAVNDTARLCQSLGHRVEPVRLPFDHQAFTEAFASVWMLLACVSVDSVSAAIGVEPSPELFEAWTLALRDDALRRGGLEGVTRSAAPVIAECAARLHAFMDDWDVVLTPVVQGLVPRLGLREISSTCSYQQLLRRVLDYASYTPMHNAIGTPAMSVPLHWDRNGLPIGSHFFSRVGDEATLLALAYELEQARPWANRRASLS